MSENYLTRLREVEKNIESMLDFEKRALDRWGDPPIGDEKRMANYRDYTEPIVRTITAYEQSLGFLRNYFPELKKEE